MVGLVSGDVLVVAAGVVVGLKSKEGAVVVDVVVGAVAPNEKVGTGVLVVVVVVAVGAAVAGVVVGPPNEKVGTGFV